MLSKDLSVREIWMSRENLNYIISELENTVAQRSVWLTQLVEEEMRRGLSPGDRDRTVRILTEAMYGEHVLEQLKEQRENW